MDTGAQVTGLIWSKTYRELVTAHGFSQNQLILWKYPTMNKVLELPHAHGSRILHMAMSPDGQMVCTGAADENLKMWNLFDMDDKMVKKKMAGGSSTQAKKKQTSPDFGCATMR